MATATLTIFYPRLLHMVHDCQRGFSTSAGSTEYKKVLLCSDVDTVVDGCT